VAIQWFLVNATDQGNTQTDPSENGYIIRKHQRLRVPYEEGIVDELLSPQPPANWNCCTRVFHPAPTPGSTTATAAKRPGMYWLAFLSFG